MESGITVLLHTGSGFNQVAAARILLEFDPVDAVHVFRARVKSYEEFLGTQLCILGSYFGRTFTVMMDEERKVYSGADDTLRYIADSGGLAIEVLLSCQGKSQLLKGG